MRFVSRFVLAAVALALVPAVSLAQPGSSSSVSVVQPVAAEPYCLDTSPEGTSSAASCPPGAIPFGFAGSSGESDAALRSAAVSAVLNQDGGPVDASAVGLSTFYNWVYINGLVNDGDYLIFRVNFSGAASLAAEVLDVETDAGFYIDLDTYDGAYATHSYFVQACDCGGDFEFTDVGDGIGEFRIPIFSASSFYFIDYAFTLGASVTIVNETGSPAGLANASIQLLAIDAFNANDEFLGTTTFYEGGDGELYAESAVPEPASLILVGTGLLVAIGVSRRRRAA